ncbi:hypothetical protein ACP3WJ_08395 [Salmonella enterica]|uniref:hypothetical protein n=1 Tax=Salmonella enterica TaxID=28901 RepID=UPI003CF06242
MLLVMFNLMCGGVYLIIFTLRGYGFKSKFLTSFFWVVAIIHYLEVLGEAGQVNANIPVFNMLFMIFYVGVMVLVTFGVGLLIGKNIKKAFQ